MEAFKDRDMAFENPSNHSCLFWLPRYKYKPYVCEQYKFVLVFSSSLLGWAFNLMKFSPVWWVYWKVEDRSIFTLAWIKSNIQAGLDRPWTEWCGKDVQTFKGAITLWFLWAENYNLWPPCGSKVKSKPVLWRVWPLSCHPKFNKRFGDEALITYM